MAAIAYSLVREAEGVSSFLLAEKVEDRSGWAKDPFTFDVFPGLNS